MVEDTLTRIVDASLAAIRRFQETVKAHPDQAREVVAALFDKSSSRRCRLRTAPATSSRALPRSAACSRSIAVPNGRPYVDEFRTALVALVEAA